MTQEEQEEVKLLKELIADKSISSDEREIYEDALNELMKSEKPKAMTSPSKPKTTQRKTRTAPTKKVAPAKTKQTATDVEKAKAEIKAKTGKTEAECESIIEQYRSLRTKAQEGKRKAEQASADNKQRVGKLERKGDIIAGTNEKTADAVIESTAKDVAQKIDKQVEAIEKKATTEAKAEVAKDKTITTPQDKKEAIDAIVDEKVKANTKPIVKRIVIDTSALLTSIATSLGKFDKDSQKEFLIKLRSDIDKLLTKYAFGGMTDGAMQVMNVQQSNMSSSSVNPSQFGEGGGVFSKGRVVLADGKGVGGNKNKTYQLIKFDYTDGSGDEGFEIREMPSNKVMFQGTNYGSVLQYFNLYTGKFGNGGEVASNLSVAETKSIARQLVNYLGSDFKVTDGSFDVASFDLDYKGYKYGGGSYLIHENGDVVNYGLPEKPVYYNYKTKKRFDIKMAKGGGVRIGSDDREYPYGSAWKLEHNKNNKNEDYEVPASQRKYSVGGTLLSGMVGAYVGYQYGKKGKKAFKFEDGGVIGQEIVFDDRGEENTGVIKDITNAGDYIVLTDNGRSVLAKRDMDVISLGAMAKAPMMEAKKKRFGFFGEGGKATGVEWMKYDGQYEAELGDLYLIIEPATERGLYQVRVKKGYRGETIGESQNEISGLDKAKDLAYDIAGDYYKQFGGGGGVGKYSTIDLRVTKPYGNEEMEIAKFKGRGDAYISASALNNNSPSNYEYLVGNSKKYAGGGGVDNPSRQQMLNYLNMYFDYYSELRTIAVEEDNILTRRMLKSLDDEQLEMAYDDAQYEIKADTQYESGGGVHTMPDGRVMLNSAHYENGGGVGNDEKYYIIFNESGSYNKRDAVIYKDDLSEKDAYEISNELNKSFPSPTDEDLYFVEKASDSKFNYGNINKRFLNSIDIQYKLQILINISRHYGISIVDAEKEVTDVESELLEDYITDESLRRKVYSDRRNRRYARGGVNMNDSKELENFIVNYNRNARKSGMNGFSKGDLMKMAYGDNYTNVDSALPMGLLEEMGIDKQDYYFYVMDYNNNSYGKLTNLMDNIAQKNPMIEVYDEMYEISDTLPIMSAVQKYKNQDVLFEVKRFAQGGMTEHGLKEGDKIVFDHLVDENIDIIDRNGKKHVVDLDKGKRYD